MSKPTVIDIFCGAGGFSEGFRQQGFKIIAGYDHWRPAVETFSYNFGKDTGVLKNILDFKDSDELIEQLPDTDVIIGSPPCVSFSNSNRSGKADKSTGIKLTKAFLKIVAIKKHKRGSVLKAWFMENVTKSIDHVSKDYSFNQLGLKKWAIANGYDPKGKALRLKQKHIVMNSADYGCPQQRIRAVAGEIICKDSFVVPKRKFKAPKEKLKLPNHITLGSIKSKLPKPNETKSEKLVIDPCYPGIKLKLEEFTDHFYDTGLYKSEWNNSKFQKINHPYMGRMSFPENESKPSRTITATKIGTSREAIIYRSEYNRIGNGQYRTPTVRESSILMGFPITYQFMGGESTKCRLVGNAVCPSVSRALASVVRREMGLYRLRNLVVTKRIKAGNPSNLNVFEPIVFDDPPRKKRGARFRRHPFKYGNITVTLSNYNIKKKSAKKTKTRTGTWRTSVQYGNGDGFPYASYEDGYYKSLTPIIGKFENGKAFISNINNGFSDQVATRDVFQRMYEEYRDEGQFIEPTALIEKVASLINKMKFKEPNFIMNGHKIFRKPIVPKKQILALYTINKICSMMNSD
jgi:DNA (cytosine-5)-methyltransferase 1